VPDGYSVSQEAMVKGAQAVDEATRLIKQHMLQLDSEVQTMFGGWQSTAAKSFGNLHASWIAQQQKLQGALEDMHNALVQTKQTYAAQEDDQSGQFNSITGQL